MGAYGREIQEYDVRSRRMNRFSLGESERLSVGRDPEPAPEPAKYLDGASPLGIVVP